MTTYYIIILVALLLIAAYYYSLYRKKKVFDKFIELNVKIDFTEKLNIKTKSKHGLLIFNVTAVHMDARALSFDKISVASSKIQLRNYNRLYTKLPLPEEGMKLSVGVRKQKKLTKKDLENTTVKISGNIVGDQNTKIPFRKKITVAFVDETNVLD